MTQHLPPHRILSTRDGEAELGLHEEAHLQGCATCRSAMEHALRRQERIESALPPGPTLSAAALAEARGAVRARLERTGRPHASVPVEDGAEETDGEAAVRALRPRRSWLPGGLGSLSRAAGILLLVAGGAAALPGSPVRSWLEDRLGDAPPVPAVQPEAMEAPAAGTGEPGIRLRVETGPVEVTVTGVDEETRVEVTRGAARELAVFAPEGSRFRSGDGEVEVEAVGGPVRVRLPARVFPATLTVSGRVYLRWDEAGPEILGPAAEREGDRIVFGGGGVP